MAIYYCKAGASGSNSGTESDPWQSLADITGLSSGDTVRLSGKFRESLTPVDGVTYEQWEGEDRCIIDGSDIFSSWTGPDGNGGKTGCHILPFPRRPKGQKSHGPLGEGLHLSSRFSGLRL